MIYIKSLYSAIYIKVMCIRTKNIKNIHKYTKFKTTSYIAPIIFTRKNQCCAVSVPSENQIKFKIRKYLRIVLISLAKKISFQ